VSHFLRYPPLLASQRDDLVLSGDAPDGFWGDDYSYTYQITGGRPPYNITLDSGELPPLLVFSTAVTTGPATGNWTISPKLEDRLEFTSPPYALEVVEELSVTSAGITAGRVFEPYVIPPEGLDVTATITAGQLKELFVGYPVEGLDMTAAVASGRLSNTFINYLPEALDTTTSIVSGEIRTILIQNSMAAEGLDTTTQITAGTLT